MSFWTKLRRRHIFRIAAVYAATGWLVLQLGAIVFPALHAPGWCLPVLIGFVALGFPVALVLAWAFEVTPDGMRRTEIEDSGDARKGHDRRRIGQGLNITIIVVLAAAVGVLFWRQLGSATKRGASPKGPVSAIPASGSRATGAASAVTIPAKSIAVLPFENLSADKDNAYFADGMQDLILTRLADIGDLKVISRTSTEQFDSHPGNLEEIARKLGVATILEGSVQKAGNQVLINVQLIDARTDGHMWAQSYTRTLSNIFKVEGEVAQKIADALDAKLTAPEKRRLSAEPTANPEAKEAYIRGLAVMSSGPTPANRERATAAYRHAVTLDPKFGVAWAALASDEAYLYFDHVGNRQAHLARARTALAKARELAPDTAETQLAIGVLKISAHLDFRGAGTAFQRAAELAPGNSDVMLAMARVEEALGHWEKATLFAHNAVALDPLDPSTLVRAADVFITDRDFAHALSLADRMLDIQSDDPLAIGMKASIYQEQGRFSAAGKLLSRLNFSHAAMVHSQTFRVALHQKFLTRDYASVLHLLRPLLGHASPLSPDWQVVFRPMLARAEWLSGHLNTARELYAHQAAAVRRMMREKSESDPYSQAVAHLMLAEAEAGLNHRAAALAAGRRAEAYDPEAMDAAGGRQFIQILAGIEASVGARGPAIALLQHLLTVRYFSPITVPLLRADPIWDPLRKDPRFQALLNEQAGAPASVGEPGATL